MLPDALPRMPKGVRHQSTTYPDRSGSVQSRPAPIGGAAGTAEGTNFSSLLAVASGAVDVSPPCSPVVLLREISEELQSVPLDRT